MILPQGNPVGTANTLSPVDAPSGGCMTLGVRSTSPDHQACRGRPGAMTQDYQTLRVTRTDDGHIESLERRTEREPASVVGKIGKRQRA